MLDSDPPRNITEYALTFTPEDGGPPETVFIPAEAGNFTVPGLQPETVYELDIAPVIVTEGQTEPGIYNLGQPPLDLETCK